MSTGSSPAPAPGGIVVRVLAPEEVATLQPVVAEHARYERRQQPLAKDWAERARALVTSGLLTLFVAARGGYPIGYAALTRETSTWSAARYAHLDCLFVCAEERGGGVGRLLFDAVASVARGRGDGELQWQTPAWNTDAIRFYDRLDGSRDPKQRYIVELRPCAPASTGQAPL